METNNKKVILESAIKAIEDQINTFSTFEEGNVRLTVLIMNLKSIVDSVNERGGCNQDTGSVPCCDNIKKTQFQKANVPPLYSIDDVADKRIQNVQDILNAVEVQIRAFQYFAYKNLRLSVLCKNIHDILENVKETMLELERHKGSLKMKVLTEADAIRAVRAVEVNNALHVTKEKAGSSTFQETEVVSKSVKQTNPEQLVSDREPAHEINSLQLPDRTQVIDDIRSSEKFISGYVENISQATSLVDKINSDEISADVGYLLGQVLRKENCEMKMIEQVIGDSNKVKELCNSLKKDITDLVIPSLKEKERLKSSSILTELGVSQSSYAALTAPVPCSKTLEVVAEKMSQNDLVVTCDSIREDPNIKVSKESELPNSKEMQKVFESKPRDAQTNELNKMPKSVNRTGRWDPKSFNSNNRQIFVKMTVPISEIEIMLYFAQLGLTVLGVQAHMYPIPSWNSAGYAFVTFSNVEIVHELLKHRDRNIFGKWVRISKVKDKDPKESCTSNATSSPRLVSNEIAAHAQNTNSSFDSFSGTQFDNLRRSNKVPRSHEYRHHPYK